MRLGASGGTILLVALGGMAGGVFRALLLAAGVAAASLTLLGVNILGSWLIGLILALSEPGRRHRMPPGLSVGLMAGFCGALTTFSAFILEVLTMKMPIAALYLLGSLVTWLAAAALGLLIGRYFNPAIETGRNRN